MTDLDQLADDIKVLRDAGNRLADWNDLDRAAAVSKVVGRMVAELNAAHAAAKGDGSVTVAEITVSRVLQADGQDTWDVKVTGEPAFIDGLGMLEAAKIEYMRQCTGGCPFDTLDADDDEP